MVKALDDDTSPTFLNSEVGYVPMTTVWSLVALVTSQVDWMISPSNLTVPVAACAATGKTPARARPRAVRLKIEVTLEFMKSFLKIKKRRSGQVPYGSLFRVAGNYSNELQ